jgi:hypothetical protein
MMRALKQNENEERSAMAEDEEGENNRAGRPAFESARVEAETSPAFEEGRKSNMNMIEQHFPCSLALRT